MFLYAAKNRPDLISYFYCPDFVIKGSNLNKKIKKFSSKGKRKVGRFLSSHRLNGLIYGAETIFSSYYLIKPTNSSTRFVYLNHGYGIKATKRWFEHVLSSNCDIVYPSEDLEQLFRKKFTHFNNRVLYCGAPRTDDLFFDSNKKKAFDLMINRKNNEKTILMMTTFRRKKDGSFDYNQLLPPGVNAKKLNEDLRRFKTRLVIKLHHVFDNVDSSSLNMFSNIICLKNSDIFKFGFNTTSIMPYVDGFISDYSSSVTDFVLMNKPIALLAFDLSNFNGIDQGFIVDDPATLMPGKLIESYASLLDFLVNTDGENDFYKQKREKYSLIFNGFICPPLNCSKNLIDIYYPLKNSFKSNEVF